MDRRRCPPPPLIPLALQSSTSPLRLQRHCGIHLFLDDSTLFGRLALFCLCLASLLLSGVHTHHPSDDAQPQPLCLQMFVIILKNYLLSHHPSPNHLASTIRITERQEEKSLGKTELLTDMAWLGIHKGRHLPTDARIQAYMQYFRDQVGGDGAPFYTPR